MTKRGREWEREREWIVLFFQPLNRLLLTEDISDVWYTAPLLLCSCCHRCAVRWVRFLFLCHTIIMIVIVIIATVAKRHQPGFTCITTVRLCVCVCVGESGGSRGVGKEVRRDVKSGRRAELKEKLGANERWRKTEAKNWFQWVCVRACTRARLCVYVWHRFCGYKWVNMILSPSFHNVRTHTHTQHIDAHIISASKYYKSELNFKLLSTYLIVARKRGDNDERWSVQRHLHTHTSTHIFHRYIILYLLFIRAQMRARTHIERKYLYFQIYPE